VYINSGLPLNIRQGGEGEKKNAAIEKTRKKSANAEFKDSYIGRKPPGLGKR